MKNLPPLPEPRDLALPVRDLLRGLRQKTAGPRAMFEPALGLLPASLRESVAEVLRDAARGEIKPFRVRPPGGDAIARAAAGLRGAPAPAAEIAACAVYGGAVLLAGSERDDLLVSETVAALCWREAARRAHRAAAFAQCLDRHDFIGTAPGFVHDEPDPRGVRRREICAAIVMWLLADRAEPDPGADAGADAGSGEAELLRIGGWLANGLTADLAAAWDDPAALDALLRDTAGKI